MDNQQLPWDKPKIKEIIAIVDARVIGIKHLGLLDIKELEGKDGEVQR